MPVFDLAAFMRFLINFAWRSITLSMRGILLGMLVFFMTAVLFFLQYFCMLGLNEAQVLAGGGYILLILTTTCVVWLGLKYKDGIM